MATTILASEAAVKEMVKDAKASAEGERKRRAATLLDYYYSDADTDIEDVFAQVFRKPGEKIKVEVNTTRKPINTLAQVFAQPPDIRVVNGAGKHLVADQALWDWLWKRGQWQRKLRTADRWKKLLQTFHIRVHRAGPPPGAENAAERSFLRLDLVSPASSSVRQNATNPQSFDAIIIRLSGAADTAAVAQAEQHLILTEDRMIKTDGEGRQLPINGSFNTANPYAPILPVIKIDDIEPKHDRYWNRGRWDLAATNRVANVMMTALAAGTWSQGWSQVLAINIDEDTIKTAGPDNAWLANNVRDDKRAPDVKAIELRSDIEGMKAGLEFLIQSVALQNELPAQEFSVEGKAESGFAKMINRAPLLDEREGDLPVWSGYMQELFRVVKRVYEVEAGAGRIVVPPGAMPELTGAPFQEDARLEIDYAEPRFPESPKEEFELVAEKMAKGFASPVDVMMHLEPDLDRETAKERLREIAAERSEFEGVLPSFQVPGFGDGANASEGGEEESEEA